jgi:ribosomal protein S18 acetylase RimI-like enzyme
VPFSVRTLAEAEVERGLDLFEAVAAEGRWLATEVPLDRREVGETWRDLLASGQGTILVAEEGGGTLVGLAVLAGTSAPELGMLVREDRRRQGVGDGLVQACVAWARARGASAIVLQVFAHNEAAIALYRKHGFEARAPYPRSYRRRSGDRWLAIRMVKPL